MSIRVLLRFAVATSFAAAPALAANQIVVRSSGPSAKAYPVGKQIPEGAKISLQLGDRLTVLGPSKAMVLQGPGSFSVVASQEADQFSRSRFSARRGPPVPRGPWALDVEQSGQICASKEPLRLWRSSNDSEANVTILGDDGKTVTLTWPAGDESLDWPSELPLKEGLSYKIQLAGRPAATEWKIASVSPWVLDRAATAEALLKGGCEAQLDQLVDRALWEN